MKDTQKTPLQGFVKRIEEDYTEYQLWLGAAMICIEEMPGGLWHWYILCGDEEIATGSGKTAELAADRARKAAFSVGNTLKILSISYGAS